MSRCASRLCPVTFSSTLPVGYAAPPLARLGGLSRSRPSLGPAPAHQQWPRTKRPATGTLGRGLWRSLLRDLGPGVGAEAAVESWPQRKGALGHTHADRRGARTHRPTADRRSWAGSGVGGGTCGGAVAVGAAETRPRCPLGLGGAAAGPSLLPRVTCGSECHVIGAAPGTSGEGQYPAQEARAHFSLGVLARSWWLESHLLVRSCGTPGTNLLFLLLPLQQAEFSAKECAGSEAFSIPPGSRGTRGSHQESI